MAASTTNRWKLGLFVTVGLALGIGSVFWLAASSLRRESFPAVTYFDESVQGLEIGSPVKFRGVTIGSVADISVASDRRHVEVRADIDRDVLERLGLGQMAERGREHGNGPFAPTDLRVQIVPAGITGLMFLQVDFFDPVKHPPRELPFEPPWNYVPSVRSTLKSLEYAVLDAVEAFPTVIERVEDVLLRLDEALAAADVAGIAADTRRVLDSTDAAIRGLDTESLSAKTAVVLDDASRSLRGLERFIANLEDDDGPLQRLVGRLDRMAAELERAVEEADLAATAASFRDTSAAFAAAAQQTGPITQEMEETLIALREAAVAMRSLAELLERNPSALIRGRDPAPSIPMPYQETP